MSLEDRLLKLGNRHPDLRSDIEPILDTVLDKRSVDSSIRSLDDYVDMFVDDFFELVGEQAGSMLASDGRRDGRTLTFKDPIGIEVERVEVKMSGTRIDPDGRGDAPVQVVSTLRDGGIQDMMHRQYESRDALIAMVSDLLDWLADHHSEYQG